MTIGTPTVLLQGGSGIGNGQPSAGVTVGASIGTLVVIDAHDTNPGQALTTVVDSAGNSYTKGVERLNAGTPGNCSIWYCYLTNTLNIGNTFTGSTPGGNWYFSVIAKVTGTTGAADIAVSTTGSSTGTSISLASGALASSNEILFGTINFQTTAPTSLVPGTGFTELSNNPGVNGSFQYQIVASNASVTWNPSWTGSVNNIGALISFQGTGGAASANFWGADDMGGVVRQFRII